MTLFVVLGLVAVVVGVLVAVALGVRSMRAEERGEDDWDSPVSDNGFADPEQPDRALRRGGERRRPPGARRAPRPGGTRADYGDVRGRDRADGHSRRPGESGPGQKASRGRGQEYQHATGYGQGHERPRTGPPGPGGSFSQPAAAPLTAPVSAAGLAATPPGTPGDASALLAPPPAHPVPAPAAVPARPARRHSVPKDQPTKRPRQPRSRTGNAADWDATNWDGVSDEDYWAELSADKPLAARTAQSAADLGPRESEPKETRHARTDPHLAQPEPQTATMAMPGIGATSDARAGNDRAKRAKRREAATLPVRRSGSMPDTGQVVPATSASAARSKDYADPSLAVLASMGDLGSPATPAAGMVPAPTPSMRPPAHGGSWPNGEAARGDRARRDRDYATPAGGIGTHYPPPPAAVPPASAYGAASGGYRGTRPDADATAAGYLGETPRYDIPASHGHAAMPPLDISLGAAPERAAPASGYGLDSARPVEQPGRHSGMTGPSAGRHASGTPSPEAPYGYPANGRPSHGTAQPSRWGLPDAPAGRPGETTWAPATPAVPGPPPASSAGSYTGSYQDGYRGVPTAGSATAPSSATGQEPASGYVSQAPSGGFASGYLSSSALSARHRMPEPEPLASAGPGNPYGSYVTGPSSDDDAGGADPADPAGREAADGYRSRGSRRGYGSYGDSHR